MQQIIKRKLIPSLILSAAILFVVILIKTSPQAPEQSVKESAWKVAAKTVSLETHTPNVLLYGKIESPRHSTLTAGIQADVMAKLVDEGDRVIKNQQLLTLDNRDTSLLLQQREAEVIDLQAQIQAEYLRHEADKQSLAQEEKLVKLRAREVARHKQLFKNQTGSAVSYDQAQAELALRELSLTTRAREVKDHANRRQQLQAKHNKAVAQVKQAQLDLSRSEIRSPFNGKIARFFVSVGNRVRVGDQLVELYDEDALEVRSQIPARHLATIRRAIEQQQTLTATAKVGEQTIELTLDRLTSTVGAGRSGLDALFKMTQHNQATEIGKTLALRLNLLPEKKSLLLPHQAFYDLNRVYLVRNGRLHGITVTRLGSILLENNQQRIVVRSSKLLAGDQVMITQLPNAVDGLKVTIANKKDLTE